MRTLRFLTGTSWLILKIEGCAVEYPTRFSTATALICGFGLAMKPTSCNILVFILLLSGRIVTHTSSSSVGMFN